MGPSRLSPPYFARIRLLAAAMMVIIGGLCLRAFGYEVGLPFVAVKYGGSVLWGGDGLSAAGGHPSVPLVRLRGSHRRHRRRRRGIDSARSFPGAGRVSRNGGRSFAARPRFLGVEYRLLCRRDRGGVLYVRTGLARLALFAAMIEGRTSRYPSNTTIVLI